MSVQRYKDDSFHMLETFGKQNMQSTGFGIKHEPKSIIRGQAGTTWDAKHLSNFLNSSNYSNWSQAGYTTYSKPFRGQSSHKRYSSSGDHFFKTTKNNKNVSRIGNTRINPLVSSIKAEDHTKNILKQKLAQESPQRYVSPKSPMRMDGKFKFEGNSVKFRITDPLTLQHIQQKKATNFEKQRMVRLIQKRHPHGMTGIDHPESPKTQFYSQNLKEHGLGPVKIRKEPNQGRSFVIDREWKSKGRTTEDYKKQYGFPKGQFILDRKFRNTNTHGYNIVSNRTSRGPEVQFNNSLQIAHQQ